MVESAFEPHRIECEHSSFFGACREIARIYDRMGGFLAPAKRDMTTNLATIAAGIGQRRPGAIATVQDALRYDVLHKLTFATTRDRKGVSFGILWLVRALRFVLFLLANLDAQRTPRFAAAETKQCAHDAYGRAIKPFHGRFLSTVFGGMVGQIPARRKFFAEMARPAEGATTPGVDEARVQREMAAFVRVYEPLVEEIHAFLVERGLDDPWKA